VFPEIPGVGAFFAPKIFDAGLAKLYGIKKIVEGLGLDDLDTKSLGGISPELLDCSLDRNR
jgi:hypothetical protein